MNYGEALELLKVGKQVCRAGWHGKGMFLTLRTPTETSDMTESYIYITIPCTKALYTIPWFASQADALETDWELYLQPS